MLYESALVGAFNYLWGHGDAALGKQPSLSILSNAQNPLDHLIGDVFGEVEGRYFLMEFKSGKSGFFDEVHSSSAKLARTNLYQHLRQDQDCRKLARLGHFAAWSNGSLRIAPYSHTVGPGNLATNRYHELDHASFESDFDKFYTHINCADLRRFDQDTSLYADGLGLPANAMLRYLECILAHYPGVIAPPAESNAIFGFCNPTNGAVVIVPTSFNGLLGSIAEIKRTTQQPSKKSTGES